MTEEKLALEAIEQWRRNNGVGTFNIPSPFDSLKPLLYLLPAIYNKSPTIKTVIVVSDFVDKDKIKDYLTSRGTNHDVVFDNLINTGSINIITSISNEDIIHLTDIGLLIIYNPTSFLYSHLALIENSHYKLVILTKRISDDAINNFYSVCPKLGNYNQDKADEIRASRPVKEWLVTLTIPDNSELKRLIDYYDKEISTGLAIFGDFNTIKAARLGDSGTNCSSMTICDAIARQNGWNEHLDMSSQFNVDIDALYSPSALKERASNIYNIIRERSIKLASAKEKLEVIATIIDNYKDKNILIINKYPDFAVNVTDFLNCAGIKCMNYHDKVDNIPAFDDDGNAILIKSGVNKGKPKMLGATSQKKLAQKLMNKGKLHVISANSMPDKNLQVHIDVVIITSPLCETIESYLYRLSKVEFSDEIILHTLYYKGTIEERKLQDRKVPATHNILNEAEIEVKTENNYDYCIVD